MQRLTFRFERLIINRASGITQNLRYFTQVMRLYIKYLKYLEDDFSPIREKSLAGIVDFIERTAPHFYLVLKDEEVCGFFILEKFVGTPKRLYSAEVTTCFSQKYWGVLTKSATKAFKEFCFEELGLTKIKALVYPQNFRVRAVLRNCGFEKEAILKAETIKNRRLQDLDIYSVFNEKAFLNKEELCN